MVLFAAFDLEFPFIQAAGPVLLQQAGESAVGKQTAFGLAGGAIVAFVFSIDDALYGRTAVGARFAVAAVDGHLRPESGDLRRKPSTGFDAETFNPFGKGRFHRSVEARGLLLA